MKKAWIIGGIIILIVIAAVLATAANAASDKYKFVVRGVVTAVDSDAKTITAAITHATGKAKDDMQGKTILFKASTAKIYKTGSGKDVRIKLSGVKVGDEVIAKGAAKSDDTFALSWAHVNARSFEVVGIAKEHNTTLKTFKIKVDTTSYKSSTYKGKEVVMKYSDSTTFTSGGQSRESDEIQGGDQKVKVSGKISGTDWEIEKFIDNYSGK